MSISVGHGNPTNQGLGEKNVEVLSDSSSIARSGVDTAWKYLRDHHDAADTASLKKLKWKIDLHIVPLMFCCYTMQFLDKLVYNYAAVMNIQKDLNLRGNDFTNIATFFFVAYLVFEVPNCE